MSRNLYIIFYLSFILVQCSKDYSALTPQYYKTIDLDSIQISDFKLNELSISERPYHWEYPAPIDYFKKDSQGVAIFEYQGQIHYHPVA